MGLGFRVLQENVRTVPSKTTASKAVRLLEAARYARVMFGKVLHQALKNEVE